MMSSSNNNPVRLTSQNHLENINNAIDLSKSHDIIIVSGDKQEIPTSRLFLALHSPSLLPVLTESCCGSSTLILPDSSASSIKHLFEILIHGFIFLNQVPDKDKVIETAKSLSINLNNLSECFIKDEDQTCDLEIIKEEVPMIIVKDEDFSDEFIEINYHQDTLNLKQKEFLSRGKNCVRNPNAKTKPTDYMRRKRAHDSAIKGVAKFMKQIEHIGPDYVMGSTCVTGVPVREGEVITRYKVLQSGQFPQNVLQSPENIEIIPVDVPELMEEDVKHVATPRGTRAGQKAKINQRMVALFFRLQKAAVASGSFLVFASALSEKEGPVVKHVDPGLALEEGWVAVNNLGGWIVQEHLLASINKAKAEAGMDGMYIS